MKEYKKGVHFSMPDAHYFGPETVNWLNRSKLVSIDILTKAELLDIDYTPSNKSHLRIGTEVHSRWLEDKEAAVLLSSDLRKTLAKEERDAAIAEGKEYLTPSEAGKVTALVDGLNRSARALELKEKFIGSEITILDDDWNGAPVKVRLDAITSDGYIVDLKTTGAEITREDIRETFEKFGYAKQVAMYTDVAKRWTKELGVPEIKGFLFVFVSKTNNEAMVFSVENLDQGPLLAEFKEKCRRAMEKLDFVKKTVIDDEVMELFSVAKYMKPDLKQKCLRLDQLSVL